MTSLSSAPISSLVPHFHLLDSTVVEETPSQPWRVDEHLPRFYADDLGPETDPSLAVTTVGASLAELGMLRRGPLVPDDLAAQLPGDAELVEAAIGVHQRRLFTIGLAVLGLVAGIAFALMSAS